MAHYLVGVDVGGTKTEVCLLTLDGDQYEILNRERIPTDRNGTFEQFLKNLQALIQRVISKHSVKIEDLSSIGIGIPGSVNPQTHQMSQGNVSFFKNKDLPAEFRKALNYQGTLFFDNDANCFALAETFLGAGRTFAKANNIPFDQLCSIGIILGTGVGGGLIVNGKLIRGRRGGAGEIGHMTLVESGRACYCMKFGCAEQYLSGPAFEQTFSLQSSSREYLSAKQIFKRVDENDPFAVATLEKYRDHLVTYLSNLSNILDPHVIILGGGMSTQPRIYADIAGRLSRECFLTENPPAVLQHECGDSAGVLGAALLGMFLDAEKAAEKPAKKAAEKGKTK